MVVSGTVVSGTVVRGTVARLAVALIVGHPLRVPGGLKAVR